MGVCVKNWFAQKKQLPSAGLVTTEVFVMHSQLQTSMFSLGCGLVIVSLDVLVAWWPPEGGFVLEELSLSYVTGKLCCSFGF